MDLAAEKRLVHQVLLATFSQSLVSSILQGTENTMYTHDPTLLKWTLKDFNLAAEDN